ncbi:MAG TPA: hypothetical protein VKY85_13120 [Candidatus Angelobacter sp.]|nr:hypothetical protein [Candidatus Angelobacter sp.]
MKNALASGGQTSFAARTKSAITGPASVKSGLQRGRFWPSGYAAIKQKSPGMTQPEGPPAAGSGVALCGTTSFPGPDGGMKNALAAGADFVRCEQSRL